MASGDSPSKAAIDGFPVQLGNGEGGVGAAMRK